MKAGYFGLLVLQAASTVLAKPPPAAVQIAHDDVSQLAEQAYKASEKEVKDAESNKRASGETCSWDNIRIRREWSVDYSSLSFYKNTNVI